MTSAGPFPVFGSRVFAEQDIIPAVQALVKNLHVDEVLQHAAYVILKPNYVVSNEWHTGTTTSPLLIEAMILYIRGVAGNARIAVGEGGFTYETRQAFENNGLPGLCEKYGVDLIDFNHDEPVTFRIDDARALKGKIAIAKEAVACDCIISLPALKTHTMAVTTLSMKNFMGTLSHKSIMHSQLHEKIVDLYSYYRSKAPFAIIDGFIGNAGSEVSSNPMNHGIFLASKDFVALDTIGSYVMDQDLAKCKYLGIAQQRGFGISDMDRIAVEGIDPQQCVIRYKPGCE
ncbi:MAG TPA: DUF362 domain-containing protein [Candidatus Lokiarchaeia archaeon]|nr:DUF362 domain-containing protein [Candidatus Lokiarchaeia archaeon]